MKAILHIGCEKTGTTSLQESLYNNRNRLLKRGFLFSQAAGAKNHIKLFVCSIDQSRLQVDTLVKRMGVMSSRDQAKEAHLLRCRIKKEIDALPPEVSTVIYSSEHLQARLQTKQEVETLYTILSPHFDEFEVFLYLRDPLSYAVSLFSTSLKFGNVLSSLPRPYSNEGKIQYRYNYEAILNNWGSIFGIHSMKPILFSKHTLKEGSVVEDFYDKLDIDTSEFEPVARELNISVTTDAQAFMLELNRRFSRNFQIDNSQKSAIRRKIISGLERARPGKGLQPSKRLCEEYKLAYASSNRWVEEHYIPDLMRVFGQCDRCDSETDILPSITIETAYDIVIDLMNDGY